MMKHANYFEKPLKMFRSHTWKWYMRIQLFDSVCMCLRENIFFMVFMNINHHRNNY